MNNKSVNSKKNEKKLFTPVTPQFLEVLKKINRRYGTTLQKLARNNGGVARLRSTEEKIA